MKVLFALWIVPSPRVQDSSCIRPRAGGGLHLSFGDTLTLAEARALAVARNLTLQRSEAQQYGVGAARMNALGQLLPTVSFSQGMAQSAATNRTGVDPVTGRPIILPTDSVRTFRSYGSSRSLGISLPLFVGGQRWFDLRRASQQQRSAEAAVDATRIDVLTQTTIRYYDAAEAQNAAAAAGRDLERRRETRNLAEERFRVGDIPESDLLQFREAELDAEIAVIDAEARARTSDLELLEWLGVGSSEAIPPLAPETLIVVREINEDSLVAVAVDRNPDLRRLEADRAAARQGRAGTLGGLLPSITLGFNLFWSQSGNTSNFGYTLQPQNRTTAWSLGLQWTGPWSGQLGAVRQARATRLSADAAYAEQLLAIERQVREAVSDLRRATRVVQNTDAALEIAGRALAGTEQRYRLGEASQLELRDAQSSLARFEQRAVTARYDVQRARARLGAAVGVGECP
jgi:outer membrane protein